MHAERAPPRAAAATNGTSTWGVVRDREKGRNNRAPPFLCSLLSLSSYACGSPFAFDCPCVCGCGLTPRQGLSPFLFFGFFFIVPHPPRGPPTAVRAI